MGEKKNIFKETAKKTSKVAIRKKVLVAFPAHKSGSGEHSVKGGMISEENQQSKA